MDSCMLIVISTIWLCCYGVQGTISDMIINNQPDPVSILPSGDDDFDCVDIYNQPAFNHPLLKNHKIELNPSFSKKVVNSISKSSMGGISRDDEGGCPLGMVPIERSTNTNQQSKTQQFPGQNFATLDTNRNLVYRGGEATMAIYNPHAKVNQYSMSQIWVQSGSGSQLNSIQAGWAVHSSLYGDNHTHFTVRWTIDGFKKTGCYNARCPGFVQVHPKLRPGQSFGHVSILGGDQYAVYVSLKQDKATGHWWLVTENNAQVGYWPKQLFNHLSNGASLVRYGGVSKASPDGLSPPMGSGILPKNDYKRSSYFVQIKIARQDFKMVNLDGNEVSRKIDSQCFNLYYFGWQGKDLQQTFSYGGRGGKYCGL